jgi:hypothetical protein
MKYGERSWSDASKYSRKSTTQVNEMSKKGAILSAITRSVWFDQANAKVDRLTIILHTFGEPEYRAPTSGCSADVHPLDKRDGYFNMRLRYGSRDLVQALGHIPS